jgi:hypothetical protein
LVHTKRDQQSMIHVFCFYNISTGIQSRLSFSKIFKHCNIITFDGEMWIAHEFDKSGIIMRRISVHSANSLLRGLKYIESLIGILCIDVTQRANIEWKPFTVRSCNELDRYISGVNIGFTFNPLHLYNKLLRKNGKGYRLLYHWRR